jgi:SPRY domain
LRNQIGWADNLFRTGEDCAADDGVGDDSHSWAYDGLRGKKWNGSDDDYGLALPVTLPTPTLGGSDSRSSSSSSSSGSSSSRSKTVEGKTPSTLDPTSSVATVGSECNTAIEGTADIDSADGRNPWKTGDIVGCIIDITCIGDEETSAKISFTLNGEYLGLAYSDVKSAVLTDSSQVSSAVNSDSKSKSKSKKDNESQQKTSSMTHYYPCLSLEDGEAVLLNIGQHPFSHLPKEDIHTLIPTDQTIVQNGSEVIASEEDVVSKTTPAPAAVKKGRKSKKDIAEEKSKIAAAAAAAAATVQIKSSVPIPAPFLPVIQALNAHDRSLLIQ